MHRRKHNLRFESVQSRIARMKDETESNPLFRIYLNCVLMYDRLLMTRRFDQFFFHFQPP